LQTVFLKKDFLNEHFFTEKLVVIKSLRNNKFSSSGKFCFKNSKEKLCGKKWYFGKT
jgi:hypothetical protein